MGRFGGGGKGKAAVAAQGEALQLGAGVSLDDVGDGVGQQPVVLRHIAALFGFPVKAVAKRGEGRRLAGRRRLKDRQSLRQVGAAEADGAVVQDIDEVEGMARAGRAAARCGISAGGVSAEVGSRAGIALAQAENYAGGGLSGAGAGAGISVGDGIGAGGHRLQLVPVAFQVTQQLGNELAQGKVAHRGAVVQFLDGRGFNAEAAQLFVAESHFGFGVRLGVAALVKRVGVPAGGNVGQRHPRLHPALQFQVGVHIGGGPVVDHLHGGAAAANAVNAPKPLDDADGVPVDVVVDDGVAVLEVLAFGDAVGGNQQVNIGVAGISAGAGIRAAPAGDRGEVGEDGVEVAGPGAGAGFVAGYHSDIDAQLRRQGAQLLVKVKGGVLEGGEYQQLAVGAAVPVGGGVGSLAADGIPDFGQLAVPLRGNGGHLGQGGGQGIPILAQVGRPAGQVQLGQAVGMAAPVDEKLLVVIIVIGQHGGGQVGGGQVGAGLVGGGPVAALFVAVNPRQQVVNLADGALQRQGEGMRRAFQPFEEVRPHHCDEVMLAVLLVEIVALAGGGQFGQPGRVGNIRRGLIDGQAEGADAVGQVGIGKAAGQVGGRVRVDRSGVFGELPDARHLGGVELLHQAAGAGDGHAVQQAQEVGAQVVQQPGFIPPAPARRAGGGGGPGPGPVSGFPFPKLLLRRRHHAANAAHAQAAAKGVLPPPGHQIYLVPQINQRSIHRRSRQQQRFGAPAAGDNLIQQSPVALPVSVAEVVRFVNDHQIIVGPVEVCQINAAGGAGVAGQVGMRQQSIAQAIAGKRVLDVSVGDLVQRPVFVQLFGAKHQNPVVPQLKVFDDRQSSIGFAQPHAVGQDAAVVGAQLGDDAADAVFLELVEGVPDLAGGEAGGNQIGVAIAQGLNLLAEKFVQGFVIDPLRRVVLPEARQGVQHPLLDIPGAAGVAPEPVEPGLQFGQGSGVIGGQVDFQIGPVAAAQPAFGKVGAAHHGGVGGDAIGPAAGGEVKLPMQKAGLPDGTDVHAGAGRPGGAAACQLALVQGMVGEQPGLGKFKGFGFRRAGIQLLHRGGVAKKETHSRNAFQLLGQQFVTIDGKVGGYEVKGSSGAQMGAQVVGNGGGFVVQDAGAVRHGNVLSCG